MLASAAIPMLLVGGGFLLAALGLFAFYAYVWGYTPLKRRSSLALYVGAVPGALPPLMGWATATGHADAPALALFAVMFVWQIPHFVAIAIFRAEDYAGAGFRVLSLAREPALTRITIVVSTVLLVPVSLLLPLLGVAGPLYLVAALVLGLVFVVIAARGLRHHARDDEGNRRAQAWAKGLFLYSLLYLVACSGRSRWTGRCCPKLVGSVGRQPRRRRDSRTATAASSIANAAGRWVSDGASAQPIPPLVMLLGWPTAALPVPDPRNVGGRQARGRRRRRHR
jgi:hypothetical protein